MVKAGLTGGIGSGKSAVARVFVQLGVPVFAADDEAKFLREHDPEVRSQVLAAFGTTDRQVLAGMVFNDPEQLKALNAIIHPAVQRRFEEWLDFHKGKDLVIKEAAILFEAGADKGLDKVITVVSPEELKIARVMKRDGVSRDQVLSRMQNQWSDEERIKRSHYVIQNDEQHMIIPQVLAVHKELTSKK